MSDYVSIVTNDLDYTLLQTECNQIITAFGLELENQISLTSISGNNDWLCSTGKIKYLLHPERFYATLNKYLNGWYIQHCLSLFPGFYRWRIMILQPSCTYSIHSDSEYKSSVSRRIHIPVTTNPESFLCFFRSYPTTGTNNVIYHHLDVGNAYLVDTDTLHTAVNHGVTPRIHIVGVTYENRNNWAQ